MRAPSESDLPEIMRRMRAAEGLDIRDRRHLLTVHSKCFVGSEAVEWMTRALGLTRAEAVRLGQLLVEQGFAAIQHR